MKKFIFSTVLCSVFTGMAFTSNAKIWRLNNNNGGAINPPINADFTGTIQQAHDNASVQPGDTIHVEQSNTSYGNLIMTKRLVIIGAGYFLNENPNTQVNRDHSSIVGGINMLNSGCSGSVITGLTITSTVNMGANRLVLTRNYLSLPAYTYIGVGTGNASNIDSVVISANYISGSSYTYNIQTQPSTSGTVTNFICSNNLVTNSTNSTMVALGSSISGIIRNNFFNGPSALSVYNMYVVNNIQNFTNNSGGCTFNNSVIEFNMGMSNAFFITPSGSNNTISNNVTNSTPGFAGTGSTDGRWKLQPGAAAQGAGKNGEDMGMFGGQIPYALSGLPMVPNVYALTIDPIVPGASTINVTVSTKSN